MTACLPIDKVSCIAMRWDGKECDLLTLSLVRFQIIGKVVVVNKMRSRFIWPSNLYWIGKNIFCSNPHKIAEMIPKRGYFFDKWYGNFNDHGFDCNLSEMLLLTNLFCYLVLILHCRNISQKFIFNKCYRNFHKCYRNLVANYNCNFM